MDVTKRCNLGGMKWLALGLLVVGCTTKNPEACCENDTECTRLGLEPDDLRPCVADGTACVANTCQSSGCDGDEDCRDANLPHCVAGACTAGCDGNEDCADPAFPLCIDSVCSVDCEARNGRVVFQTDRDGDEDLFVMFGDGFGPTPVMPTMVSETKARWSPDGTKLAFLSDDDADFDVYIIDVATPNPKNVSNNTVADDHVQWSPDGMKLGFDSATSPLVARTVSVDGADLHDLLGVSNAANTEPSWGPDSTQVVFRSSDQIWKASFDGSASTPIAMSSGGVRDILSAATWSPDGQLLAWSETVGVSGFIFVRFADPNGSTVGGGGGIGAVEISELVWAPDSAKILFVVGQVGQSDIWRLELDGTATQLTTSAGDDVHPRWSPDGKFIVFESERDGNREIYRMNADGSQQTNLTNHPGDDRFPDWGRCPTP